MIAGTLGPVASAFSICALVRPWRQRLTPGADVDLAPFLEDPAWYGLGDDLDGTSLRDAS